MNPYRALTESHLPEWAIVLISMVVTVSVLCGALFALSLIEEVM